MAPQNSSYITNVIICLNDKICQNILRRNETVIYKLKPYTSYNVKIWTRDGSFQTSTVISKTFKTKEAGKHTLYLLQIFTKLPV